MNNFVWSPPVTNEISTVAELSPAQTHGPRVQTGPTRGQNRSRNQNGRWRKKRSDAGISRN